MTPFCLYDIFLFSFTSIIYSFPHANKTHFHNKMNAPFVSIQARGKKSGGLSRYFGTPKLRNIMSGILLAPGPVATHKAVKSLSSVFNLAVTKTKFETAAQKLQASGLGQLVTLQGVARVPVVFVKKVPEEMARYLQLPGNGDLCSASDYELRFHMPTPSYNLTDKVKGSLIQMGLISADMFPMEQGQGGIPQQEQNFEPDSPSSFDEQLGVAKFDLG